MQPDGCENPGIYICPVDGFIFTVLSSRRIDETETEHTIEVTCNPPTGAETFIVTLPCNAPACGTIDLSGIVLTCGSPGIVFAGNTDIACRCGGNCVTLVPGVQGSSISGSCNAAFNGQDESEYLVPITEVGQVIPFSGRIDLDWGQTWNPIIDTNFSSPIRESGAGIEVWGVDAAGFPALPDNLTIRERIANIWDLGSDDIIYIYSYQSLNERVEPQVTYAPDMPQILRATISGTLTGEDDGAGGLRIRLKVESTYFWQGWTTLKNPFVQNSQAIRTVSGSDSYDYLFSVSGSECFQPRIEIAWNAEINPSTFPPAFPPNESLVTGSYEASIG